MAKSIKTPRKQSLVRRKNFIFLFNKFADENPGPGALARFAAFVGINASYLSQVKSAKVGAGIGFKTASKIEAAFKLPAGWLDHQPSKVTPTQRAQIDAVLKVFRQAQNDPELLEELLVTFFSAVLNRDK